MNIRAIIIFERDKKKGYYAKHFVENVKGCPLKEGDFKRVENELLPSYIEKVSQHSKLHDRPCPYKAPDGYDEFQNPIYRSAKDSNSSYYFQYSSETKRILCIVSAGVLDAGLGSKVDFPRVLLSNVNYIDQKIPAKQTRDYLFEIIDRPLQHHLRKSIRKKDPKVEKVGNQISGVKEIMLENIDMVLERGGKIEELVEATDRLVNSSTVFLDSSKELKESMLCCGGLWTATRKAKDAVVEKGQAAGNAIGSAFTPSRKPN